MLLKVITEVVCG